MYSNLESDEKRRREVVSSLYWSLMQNWDIPQSIQDYYGFSEDYRLFHQLEGMDSDVYYRKRETGEVPDILEVDARLTRAVEAVFESVCRRPPDPYLERLDRELKELGRIAAWPSSVHEICYIRSSLLAKYGIDKDSPAEVICRQAEKAYRDLDARCVKMTGRKPYADEFFRFLRNERAKQEQAAFREDTPRRKPRISVRAKAKGRKRGI